MNLSRFYKRVGTTQIVEVRPSGTVFVADVTLRPAIDAERNGLRQVSAYEAGKTPTLALRNARQKIKQQVSGFSIVRDSCSGHSAHFAPVKVD